MFDSKRFKTFKWLEKIADNSRGNEYIHHVYILYGQIFATDGYILAQVEYPEFVHVADDSFLVLESYTDGTGKHLKDPVWKCDHVLCELRTDYFSRFFLGGESTCLPVNVDSKLLDKALQPFKINGLDVYMCSNGDKLQLSGHNSDVSIKVLVMGKRL